MARTRSPQYPVIGLKEAVDKVRMVWNKDYTNELPRHVVAEHMGYNSLNGKSLGVLSAAGKFGLLTGRGDETRVSLLAVKILAHETGDPERVDAVRDAALLPALFSDIEGKFGAGKASDQALRSYLLTRGFTHGAADAAIRAYRETEEFVDSECSGYGGSELEPESDANQLPETRHGNIVAAVGMTARVSGARVPSVTLGDNGLELSGGVITTLAQFEKLMKRLNAAKVLLDVDADDLSAEAEG